MLWCSTGCCPEHSSDASCLLQVPAVVDPELRQQLEDFGFSANKYELQL